MQILQCSFLQPTCCLHLLMCFSEPWSLRESSFETIILLYKHSREWKKKIVLFKFKLNMTFLHETAVSHTQVTLSVRSRSNFLCWCCFHLWPATGSVMLSSTSCVKLQIFVLHRSLNHFTHTSSCSGLLKSNSEEGKSLFWFGLCVSETSELQIWDCPTGLGKRWELPHISGSGILTQTAQTLIGTSLEGKGHWVSPVS